MERFTADEKVAIVMESFTSNNIAELCRRHGVSLASFYKWRDKFMEERRKKEERRLKSRKIKISRRNESVSILHCKTVRN